MESEVAISFIFEYIWYFSNTFDSNWAENNIGLRFSLKNGALTQRVPKGIHK